MCSIPFSHVCEFYFPYFKIYVSGVNCNIMMFTEITLLYKHRVIYTFQSIFDFCLHFCISTQQKKTSLFIFTLGKWLLHSGQLGAQNDGMVTTYNVGTCRRPQITFVPFKERYTVRRMYIAAVEVDWEYAPRKLNTMTLTDLRNPDT